MSTLLLMKLFESTPSRYERGIRCLTRGRLDCVYDRLADHVKTGDRILDIGCGTGALSLRAAKRGARVKAIDINPGMLDRAQSKAKEGNLSQSVEFVEMGVAELGKEEDQSYDAVMSGLCLSELTDGELDHTLKEVHRILKPGGLFLVVDEVRPKSFFRRFINSLFRALLKAFVFLISGTTTRALKDFESRIEREGFRIISSQLNKGQNFLEVVVKKIKV